MLEETKNPIEAGTDAFSSCVSGDVQPLPATKVGLEVLDTVTETPESTPGSRNSIQR
jgi:hypothetical protein